jgi:hypothetical protein
VSGATGTFGAVVVVVGNVVVDPGIVVLVVEVVVVVESAVATGPVNNMDPTPMTTARVSERRIRVTYLAHPRRRRRACECATNATPTLPSLSILYSAIF